MTQAITVAVTDRAENGTGSNVFGSTDAPTTIETTDPTDYELGMRFTANAAGSITELRYFRGAADAERHRHARPEPVERRRRPARVRHRHLDRG